MAAAGGALDLTVGGLKAALASGDVALRSCARGIAGLVRQPEWVAALGPGPVAPPAWRVSPCGQWVAQVEAQGAPCFVVREDGRLAPLPARGVVEGVRDCWQPACICWCPLAKGQRQLLDLAPPDHVLRGRQAALHPYLLGPWHSVWVDPNAWAVGGLPLTHYTVKSAARRLLLLSLCRSDSSFVAADGHRPRLWHMGPGSGLAGLEDRWRRVYAAKLRQLPAQLELDGGVEGRRVRRRPELPACPLYAPGWVHQAQQRVHPYQRAALAAAASARAAADWLQQAPCDAVDLLGGRPGGVDHPVAPWRKAYIALRAPRLDRQLRYFGWLLLHGALRCGACSLSWGGADNRAALFQECGCLADCCASLPVPPLDDYSHTFVHCPVVRPARQWLAGLWVRMGGAQLPDDARVWVVGDSDSWSPGDEPSLCALWLHLRLMYCRAVWLLHARRLKLRQQFSAAEVVALVVAWVRQALQRDWHRVGLSRGDLQDLPSWCTGDTRFKLPVEQHELRWCRGGVVAVVGMYDGQPRLRIPLRGLPGVR